MARVIIFGLITAFLAYRFSLTARSIRARREGDWDRAGQLSARAVALMMGTGVGVVMLGAVVLLISR